MTQEYRQLVQRSQVHKQYDAALEPIRLEREHPAIVDAAPRHNVVSTDPRHTEIAVLPEPASSTIDFSTEAISHYKGMTDCWNEWKR